MFTAEFEDGPMQGMAHVFMGASEPYADLYAIPPFPGSASAAWIIVGYTGMVPEHPWPDQVHYVLSHIHYVESGSGPVRDPHGRYVLKGEE